MTEFDIQESSVEPCKAKFQRADDIEAKPKQSGHQAQKSASSNTKNACKFCSKVFESARQLGGHTSKAHPGMSIGYQLKIETRLKRTKNRDLCQNTKKFLSLKL